MDIATANLVRKLPSVSKCLDSKWGQELCNEFGEGISKLEIRIYLDQLRSSLQQGKLGAVPVFDDLGQEVRIRIQRLVSADARRAINATGIILHTGLGRAPLGQTAIDAVLQAARYTPVQVELASGQRSLREAKVERILCELTGCEAATVVTNNAAATFLILNTLAAGSEVVISRGQLVEIGGSFRLPEVMAQSNAILREVGTTNRTHLKDYEKAVGEKTAAILYVHPSNYSIRGFAGMPPLEDLCKLGHSRNVPVVADLGSGALVPLSEFGLKNVITISEALSCQAAISCSSGDKLIGGPQSGIICGRREIVERIRENPFARMFRVDKLTLAALEATLACYVNGDYRTKLPLYRMLELKLDKLENRAKGIVEKLREIKNVHLSIADDFAFVGGGALPDEAVASKTLSIQSVHEQEKARFASKISAVLRLHVPPVFCRIHEQALVFDMRTLLEGDEEVLGHALKEVLGSQR